MTAKDGRIDKRSGNQRQATLLRVDHQRVAHSGQTLRRMATTNQQRGRLPAWQHQRYRFRVFREEALQRQLLASRKGARQPLILRSAMME